MAARPCRVPCVLESLLGRRRSRYGARQPSALQPTSASRTDSLRCMPFLTVQETTVIAPAMTAFAALAGVYLTGRRDDRKATQERDRQSALDRERRWADKRLDAHTAFAQATLDALRWCQAAGPDDPHSSEAEGVDVVFGAMLRQLNAVHDALAQLELLATRPVRATATQAVSALRRASAAAAHVARVQATTEEVHSWSESCDQALAARDAYLESAQGELGTA